MPQSAHISSKQRLLVTDFGTQTWKQIEVWARDQLDRTRNKNDAVELTADATAALRGEIRVLKRLLALPEMTTRVVTVAPQNDD
jgi:hypothetical protein